MLRVLLFTGGVAFVLAAVITPLVRAFARRIGAVAVPNNDRWHRSPTAMLGGVAIFLSVMATFLALVPHSTEMWIVVAASTSMFLMGLIDDFIHLKPYQKLVGQLLSSAVVVYMGLVLPWTGSQALNMVITFFWLVGVTNAVNMLDNMDGLAAGIASIAALSLAVNFILNGQVNEALMLAAFFGGLAGFLIYNHNPASVFMGDCGSMFVGFLLASAALLAGQGGGRSRSVVAVLAVPVLVLCIPIFDTTFVTLMRKLAGRAASQGGRDHTSHRLVALGLSERHAVWMLCGLAVLGGTIATFARALSPDMSIAAIASFAVILAILGVYLGGVRVYSEEQVLAAKQKPVVSFLIDLSHKRRIFEVALDVVLIVLSYYLAYAILFGPMSPRSGDWKLFINTLPMIVFVKLATFLAAGVYRGMWRYASLGDAAVYGRAVLLSSTATILVLLFGFRFEGFSRMAFAIDGALLLVFVAGSRFAFRILRRLMPAPHARTGRRVMIFGAGDGGELTCRELLNNTELQHLPVAFVDDDLRKAGKVLHGLRVYAGNRSMTELCARLNIDEVILSTGVTQTRLREIVSACEAAGVPVKRMKIELERVADTEVGWVLPSADSEVPAAAAAIMSSHAVPMLPIERPAVHVNPPHARLNDH